MKKFSILLLMLAICVAPALGQIQVVTAAGFSFFDSTSGNSTTTINVGTTVLWSNISGNHTVTSGFGAADPQSGALFNALLDPGNPTFQYTFMTPGCFDYYCIPHEGFGMIGKVVVIGPPPNFPGSNEDLQLLIGINGATPSDGGFSDIKTASAGNTMVVVLDSPLGTWDFNVPLLLTQAYVTGMAPPSIGAFPELHVNPSFPNLSAPIGLGSGAFGPPLLPPTGISAGFIVPTGIAGFSVTLQILVPSGIASNGFFATSDAQRVNLI